MLLRCLWTPSKKSLFVTLVLGVTVFLFWQLRFCTPRVVGVNAGILGRKLLEERLQGLQQGYKHIPYQIKESVAGLLPRNGCVCEGEKPFNLPFAQLLFPRVQAHALHPSVKGLDLQKMKRQRAQQYRLFQESISQNVASILIVAEANNPLQYPTQGVEVQPLKTILIPGLGIKESSRKLYYVNFTAYLGTLNVAAEVANVEVRGAGEMHMTLSSKFLSHLNRQMQFVTYTSTVFHPNTADTVQFETEGHQAVFTIRIHHPVTPKLYVSPGHKEYDISSIVTIATKTFVRYDRLKDLIASIRTFYPTVTIVIADDSKEPKPITGPYIEHYIMPFGKGWFAGRNLAISQITTKYVLWVDDDFIFTSSTKIERLVEVLEKTNLDLVGGAVREVTGYTATFRHTFSLEAGDEEGDCLHIRKGFYHTLEGFPNCVVTDAVINFFLAWTDKTRQVGFDPRLARIGHLEFFIDGLSDLHIGSCDDVIVNHASKIRLPWWVSESEKTYAKFRSPSSASSNVQSDLFYFKNRLKCQTAM